MADAEIPSKPAGEGALARSLHRFGQIVLVLQGGGALGAYHGGVYEALHRAGVEPDWVVGTSIGAINGGIIAGNDLSCRLDRLKQFWKLVEYEWPQQAARIFPFVGRSTANLLTMLMGNPEFFTPSPYAAMATNGSVGAEKAALYTVEPLRKTLDALIDADELSRWPTRLTVGAAKVTTSEMVYFDSADIPLRLDHIIASGALPPAFPAVRIDGSLYWDGGVLSNTPLEVVLEEHRRKPVLAIEVELWGAQGPEPSSIHEGLMREKDMRFSSRAKVAIEREKELLRLRTMVTKLVEKLPEDMKVDPDICRIAIEGQEKCLHIVRLLAPRLEREDHNKAIDFSPQGIAARWAAGRADMEQVIACAPWERPTDPMEGIIIHESIEGAPVETR